jgi:hypothetical protein
MRLSNSSVLGFSTFGAAGPSPPPPPGAGAGIRGFCNRSDIGIIKSVVQRGEIQTQQVIYGSGVINDLETVLDLLWVKKVTEIQLNGSLTAAQEQVIPLSRLDTAAEFFNAPAPHSRTRT